MIFFDPFRIYLYFRYLYDKYKVRFAYEIH